MPDFTYSPGDRIYWSGEEWTVIEKIHTAHRQAYRVTEDVTTDSVVLRPSRPEIDSNAELVKKANATR
jgi:hypothetical protein